MVKPKAKRQTTVRTLDCDESKMYGPLPGAIAYLQQIHRKHPKAELTEHWCSYSDMELRFEWQEEETQEEFEARALREEAAEERRVREREEEDAKKKRREQYNQLKKEFGHG